MPDLCCLPVVVGLFVVYKLLDWLLRLPGVGRTGDRYVLITGCDTGFGHDLARRLDSRGCHVFAACLTEKGETELTKVCSDRIQMIHLDVMMSRNRKASKRFSRSSRNDSMRTETLVRQPRLKSMHILQQTTFWEHFKLFSIVHIISLSRTRKTMGEINFLVADEHWCKA
jgi:short-subunit dehydrogenase